MDINIIVRDFEKLKRIASKYINDGDYNQALHYIQCAGKLAWNACICFEDNSIEEMIKEISSKLLSFHDFNSQKKNPKSILFIDTMCADVRGLGRIYLDALISNGYEIVYVYLKSKESSVKRIISRLRDYKKARLISIDDSIITNAILTLSTIMNEEECEKALVNCGDCDVIACTALYSNKYMESYRISYGDHTYNLGTSIYNHIIEYRDVGVYITRNYREVEKNKIIKLPFYPNSLHDIEFQGFPFNLDGKKLVVSGGQIYKTIDSEHTFYKIIRHILKMHDECIFLMLSNGSTAELEKILKDYPNRAFRLREREDLNEILKRCTLYLSTYPNSGGTMFQYAVQNKKLPLTLMKDVRMQGGFLLNESVLNIEFDELNMLLEEIDCLLDNEEYRFEKEALLNNQIITKEEFESNVDLILNNKSLTIPIRECSVTLMQSQNLVQQALSGMEAYISYLGCYPKIEYKKMFKVFPIKASIGLFIKVKEKASYKSRNVIKKYIVRK